MNFVAIVSFPRFSDLQDTRLPPRPRPPRPRRRSFRRSRLRRNRLVQRRRRTRRLGGRFRRGVIRGSGRLRRISKLRRVCCGRGRCRPPRPIK